MFKKCGLVNGFHLDNEDIKIRRAIEVGVTPRQLFELLNGKIMLEDIKFPEDAQVMGGRYDVVSGQFLIEIESKGYPQGISGQQLYRRSLKTYISDA